MVEWRLYPSVSSLNYHFYFRLQTLMLGMHVFTIEEIAPFYYCTNSIHPSIVLTDCLQRQICITTADSTTISEPQRLPS